MSRGSEGEPGTVSPPSDEALEAELDATIRDASELEREDWEEAERTGQAADDAPPGERAMS